MVTIIILASFAFQASAKTKIDRDPRCGSYCLQVALKGLDLSTAKFADLETLLGPPAEMGYSLEQLAKAAESDGAHVLGVATSLENLRDRPGRFACITHLRVGHFVLVREVDDQFVHLIDPPRSYSIPIDSFQAAWTGKALLLSPDPLIAESQIRHPTPKGWWIGIAGGFLIAGALALAYRIRRRRTLRVGAAIAIALFLSAGCGGETPAVGLSGSASPRLVVETPRHTLGDVPRAGLRSSAKIETKIRNGGGGTLTVRAIRKSCTCTSAELDRSTLGPGEEGTLRASVDLGDSPETRAASLVIESNDPMSPESVVLIEWRAVNPLQARPVSGDGPSLGLNEPGQIVFEVSSTGIDLCESCKLVATPSSPELVCRVTPADRGSGTRPEGSQPIDRLSVEIRGSEEEGTLRRVVILTLTCKDQAKARLDLPIVWSVSAPVNAIPSRLALGLRRSGEPIERGLRLTSRDHKPFRILSATMQPRDGELRYSSSSAAADAHIVTLHFNVREGAGPWRCIVLLETDHPKFRTVQIPISAIVSDR